MRAMEKGYKEKDDGNSLEIKESTGELDERERKRERGGRERKENVGFLRKRLLPPKANGILRAEYNEDRFCATARNEGENEVRGVAAERAEARGRKGSETVRCIWERVLTKSTWAKTVVTRRSLLRSEKCSGELTRSLMSILRFGSN